MVMVCNRRDFLVCGRAVVVRRYGETSTDGGDGDEEEGRAAYEEGNGTPR